MTEPFDLDARIQDAILDHLGVTHPRNVQEGLDQAAANIKQLLRDTLQAVKPERSYRSGDYFLGYNAACKDFETNITNLLKGEL